jgi:septal ring factor EnvC (AmiA/AmiB activator)
VWSSLEIVSDTVAERDRQKMRALDAIIKIHNDLPALKKDLKQLRRDIEGLIERKDEARNYLYLVVNAVNRNLTLQEIKKIAVKGMAKSK